jgi:hypothetical protein
MACKARNSKGKTMRRLLKEYKEDTIVFTVGLFALRLLKVEQLIAIRTPYQSSSTPDTALFHQLFVIVLP